MGLKFHCLKGCRKGMIRNYPFYVIEALVRLCSISREGISTQWKCQGCPMDETGICEEAKKEAVKVGIAEEIDIFEYYRRLEC